MIVKTHFKDKLPLLHTKAPTLFHVDDILLDVMCLKKQSFNVSHLQDER